MSFVASANGVVQASSEECFSRLRDFLSWRDWMPQSFRPLRGPVRPMQIGDRLHLRIIPRPRSVPLLITVTIVRVEAGREITWRGGIRGLLVGEHSFFFEAAGPSATFVRSEEKWSGILTWFGFIASRIRASASRIGQEQIHALARAVEKSA